MSGIFYRNSPERACILAMKLSNVARVCYTAETLTWPSREGFNAPTGTWRLNSSLRSRTSILPFARHLRGNLPEANRQAKKANRKVGDMTAKLSVLRMQADTIRWLGLRSEPAFLTHNLEVANEARQSASTWGAAKPQTVERQPSVTVGSVTW